MCPTKPPATASAHCDGAEQGPQYSGIQFGTFKDEDLPDYSITKASQQHQQNHDDLAQTEVMPVAEQAQPLLNVHQGCNCHVRINGFMQPQEFEGQPLHFGSTYASPCQRFQNYGHYRKGPDGHDMLHGYLGMYFQGVNGNAHYVDAHLCGLAPFVPANQTVQPAAVSSPTDNTQGTDSSQEVDGGSTASLTKGNMCPTNSPTAASSHGVGAEQGPQYPRLQFGTFNEEELPSCRKTRASQQHQQHSDGPAQTQGMPAAEHAQPVPNVLRTCDCHVRINAFMQSQEFQGQALHVGSTYATLCQRFQNYGHYREGFDGEDMLHGCLGMYFQGVDGNMHLIDAHLDGLAPAMFVSSTAQPAAVPPPTDNTQVTASKHRVRSIRPAHGRVRRQNPVTGRNDPTEDWHLQRPPLPPPYTFRQTYHDEEDVYGMDTYQQQEVGIPLHGGQLQPDEVEDVLLNTNPCQERLNVTQRSSELDVMTENENNSPQGTESSLTDDNSPLDTDTSITDDSSDETTLLDIPDHDMRQQPDEDSLSLQNSDIQENDMDEAMLDQMVDDVVTRYLFTDDDDKTQQHQANKSTARGWFSSGRFLPGVCSLMSFAVKAALSPVESCQAIKAAAVEGVLTALYNIGCEI